MLKVLLTDSIADAALAIFDEYAGIEATRTETLTPAELTSSIGEFDAIIVRSPTKLTAEIIAAGKNLKYIGRAGVGVDNIDVDAATKQDIVVMNSPDGNTVSTAEQTIALMLAVARHTPQAHASLRDGKWERKLYRGTEMAGKTLGIVGLGRVGREVARRMVAFDMHVVASDPFVSVAEAMEMHVELLPMNELLSDADWISVHVPLSSDTRGLIGAEEIAAMKDGVYLINCARGGVIDETALLDGLNSGKVAATGLDVFAEEPPGSHPLFDHPMSVFTPHLGAATADAQLRVAKDVARSVAEALSGRAIRDAINLSA